MEVYIKKKSIKGYMKSKEMRISKSSFESLNEQVKDLLDKAIENCKSNKRQTIKGEDFSCCDEKEEDDDKEEEKEEKEEGD